LSNVAFQQQPRVRASGHGVVTAVGEGIASQDPPSGEQPAAHESVPLDGFRCVDRTRRHVLACGRQQGRHRPLVPSDDRHRYRCEQFFFSPAIRSNSCPISFNALSLDSPSNDCLQRMMVSFVMRAGCGWVRMCSRRTRFMRFLRTEPPRRRGTNTEYLVFPSALFLKNSVRYLPAIRRPPRNSASTVCRPRTAPGLFGGSDREPFPSLCAPGIDDLPSAFGLHARAETVFPFPAPVVWIICRLHFSSCLFVIPAGTDSDRKRLI
jgi:hypothetical protein